MEDYIMAGAVALIGTLASLLLNAYGSSQSAEANDKAQGLLNKRINDLDSWYNAESSKDYTQTPEGQATQRRLESQMKKALESQNNDAVRTGATPESKVALQGELQEKYSDAISNLSGLTTQRKEGLRRDYMLNMNNLLNQQTGMYSQEQNNWTNLASNISGALGALSQADSQGVFDDLFNSESKYIAGTGSGMYSSRGF